MVSQQNALFSGTLPTVPLSNDEIALRLERGAELLESQSANPFRVNAYRHAAQTIRELSIPLAAVAQRMAKAEELAADQKKSETVPKRKAGSRKRSETSGTSERGRRNAEFGIRKGESDGTNGTSPKRKAKSRKQSGTLGTSAPEVRHSDFGNSSFPDGTNGTLSGKTASDLLAEKLQTLPGIGQSLAGTISTLVRTGHWELLDRLEEDASYAAILSTVPGIGTELADRIHAKLGIETLPELAAAAYDGRLSHVPGFGPKRLRSVRESLSGRLHRTAQDFRKISQEKPHDPLPDEPLVSELLSIDEQYRRQAAAGILPKVAPRRFNPTHAAWLPVLNTQREDRQYTAMYSNTARAHDLGTTKDWVVIHRSDAHGRGLWTVVTSTFGPHKGERVVRGREEEH